MHDTDHVDEATQVQNETAKSAGYDQSRIPRFPCRPVLTGQPALVTGANSGIGEAVAPGLAQAGADVAINYVTHPEKAEEVAHKVEGFGRRAIVLKADVSEEDEVDAMYAAAIAEFGTLHISVSNAGLQQDSPFTSMTLQQWNTVIGVNLTGQFLCQRAAAREFLKRGVVKEVSLAAGKMICMSSVHQQIPWAGHVNYASSKGGILMLMQSMAQELAPHFVRVNAIGPGAIRTPINTAAWSTPEAYADLMTLVPYQRHRRARRHRPGGRVAGRGRGRLRHRHDALRRRRHDALPRLRDGRLID